MSFPLTSPTYAVAALHCILYPSSDLSNNRPQLSALRGTIPSILDPALKTARSTQQKARTSAHDEYISTIYDHETETEDHATTAAAAAAPSRSLRGDASREAGRPRTSAYETYTVLMDAARTSMKDVAAFRKEWDSETTQDVLRRARESAVLDGDLEAGRGVERY